MTRRSGNLRFAAAALAAMLVNVMSPLGVARAADDSNIPGVPLPGPIVSGTLGGPVYDRVYVLDVPADRVILLSLSGDPGTDFDLYLFDSSATTVYATDGQVATSTGPGSTESIAYPTQAGGRFYVDLNGASNVEGSFRLTVKTVADTTPPTVQLRMADGAPATQDSTIAVSLIATDELSGITQMQFSLDGSTWENWREYAPFTLWSFPAVDGPRTLYARVRDRSGNVSAAVSATITIDTVRPTITSRTPELGSEIDGLRPVFHVTFSEPIRASTWSPVGFVVQDASGALVEGTFDYDDSTRTGSFTPSMDLTPGVAYLATLSGIVDLAGNPLAPVGSWVVTPLNNPGVTLTTSTRVVTYGTVITLHAHTDPMSHGPLTVERSVAGRPWQILGVVAPDPAGNNDIRTVASANSAYRLHAARSGTDSEHFSGVVSVAVRRRVGLQSVSSTLTRQMAPGTSVSLRAVLTPSGPDTTITFSVYRYDPVRRVYVLAATQARRSVGGVAAYTWRPTTKGAYYVRLTVPSGELWAAGISASYRWVVGTSG